MIQTGTCSNLQGPSSPTGGASRTGATARDANGLRSELQGPQEGLTGRSHTRSFTQRPGCSRGTMQGPRYRIADYLSLCRKTC